ncbi:MAG TPA: hypothetical protein VFQ30_09815 [Ktedonobacteraceae bacterium]|nr:hypothetical protein [Ktedonobacteraceae bacterium]
MPRQEPFRRVAWVLRSALLLGASAGFVLATVLTLTSALAVPLAGWWTAVAQAHGHLQLYGWAGLFVLGVALHFLPRLRGTPLVAPWLVPWILALQVTALLLRGLSEPLLEINGTIIWRVLLITSGMLECLALLTVVLLLGLTAGRGPALSTRPAFGSVLLFMAMAFCSLAVASIVNLINVTQAAFSGGLIASNGDDLNVLLGLFGFIVPMALAMSARSLPMYAGLEAFPGRVLRPSSIVYLVGLLLAALGTLAGSQAGAWSERVLGVGFALIGGVILVFIGVFLLMMRTRGRLPKRVTQLAPEPGAAARSYKRQVASERNSYGPFVALVASAYLWAMLGGLLLVIYGVSLFSGIIPPFTEDAIRHSFAVGFIALLISGISVRMIPGFSGHQIASPALVSATLWLGNIAAFLRVGSLLFAPALALFTGGSAIATIAFGLSGPFGLAFAICLLINLWPALS